MWEWLFKAHVYYTSAPCVVLPYLIIEYIDITDVYICKEHTEVADVWGGANLNYFMNCCVLKSLTDQMICFLKSSRFICHINALKYNVQDLPLNYCSVQSVAEYWTSEKSLQESRRTWNMVAA